jgi:hypothetical protein
MHSPNSIQNGDNSDNPEFLKERHDAKKKAAQQGGDGDGDGDGDDTASKAPKNGICSSLSSCAVQ